MEVRNSQFTAFIDLLTSNTYVMVIMSDPTIRNFPFSLFPALELTFFLLEACAININIRAAGKHFELFFQQA